MSSSVTPPRRMVWNLVLLLGAGLLSTGRKAVVLGVKRAPRWRMPENKPYGSKYPIRVFLKGYIEAIKGHINNHRLKGECNDVPHNSILGFRVFVRVPVNGRCSPQLNAWALGTRSSGEGVGVLGPSGNEWFWVSLA